MPSATVEEYLESIYKLSSETSGLRAVRLAEQLDVSPASVAEMMKKLVDQGLITRNPDMIISLTQEGRAKALQLVRKHRLSERFLTDMVGLSWDKVHDEACRFEHILSPEVEAGISRMLGEPDTCPHGYPIPRPDGSIADEPNDRLADCAIGEQCTVAIVPEDDSKLLQYLDSLGLRPGAKASIKERSPFEGPIHIHIEGRVQAIGLDLAQTIRVKRDH